MTIILSKWYSSLVYVEDQDVLYEICEHMNKRVLGFVGYVALGDRLLVLFEYFLLVKMFFGR